MSESSNTAPRRRLAAARQKHEAGSYLDRVSPLGPHPNIRQREVLLIAIDREEDFVNTGVLRPVVHDAANLTCVATRNNHTAPRRRLAAARQKRAERAVVAAAAADLAAAVDGDGDGGGGVLTSDGVASEGKTTQSDSGGGKDTHHGKFVDPACTPPRHPTPAASRPCLPPRPPSSSSPPLARVLVLALQRVACGVLLAMARWLPKASRTNAFGLRKCIGYSASLETTLQDPFGNAPNDPFACARAMECQRALWVSYPIIGFGCACANVIFLSRSVFTESAKCMPRAQTQAFEITR